MEDRALVVDARRGQVLGQAYGQAALVQVDGVGDYVRLTLIGGAMTATRLLGRRTLDALRTPTR